jgi:superfamily I DNA and/or RNA helicase
MHPIQQELAKAFLIALEGELRIAENRNNNQFRITNIAKFISNGKVYFLGKCAVDNRPRKGSLIKPVFSFDTDYQFRVDDISETGGVSTVTFSPKNGNGNGNGYSGIPDINASDITFNEAIESSNFEKMAVATRELGMSGRLHARVLLGNQPLPPLVELNDFQPFKEKLNKYQFSAVVMALTHQLALVQGPPGTGKTLVAAELSLQHNKLCRKVLMTAKTNKAADVMAKAVIKHIETTAANKRLLGDILRLGVKEKISPELEKYTLEYKLQQHASYPELAALETNKGTVLTQIDEIKDKIKRIKDFMGKDHFLAILRNPLLEIKKLRLEQKLEELNHSAEILNAKYWKLSSEIKEHIIKTAPIIITTSYQCPRSELKGIEFDALIFDEASQATVPEAAMALVKLKNNGFLTVIGDHKQLGPIVMSDHTILKNSLYDLLHRRIVDDKNTPPNKRAMLTLRKQYRMHPDIAKVCEILAYPEGLESANLDKTLRIDTSKLNGCWQDKAINPAHAVVFVSTEEVATQETKDKSGSSLNVKEVEIIENVVQRLEEVGVLPSQIAIISAYKGQRELICDSIKKYSIGTVDSFQGDENDVVIFDITRDNMQGAVGFMRYPNRLNVAVSRARKKLIVIGNKKSLSNYVKNQVFLKFLKAVSENVVVVPAPEIDDDALFNEIYNTKETKTETDTGTE